MPRNAPEEAVVLGEVGHTARAADETGALDVEIAGEAAAGDLIPAENAVVGTQEHETEMGARETRSAPDVLTAAQRGESGRAPRKPRSRAAPAVIAPRASAPRRTKRPSALRGRMRIVLRRPPPVGSAMESELKTHGWKQPLHRSD